MSGAGFIKWDFSWARSPKMAKLRRLGVDMPAVYLLRVWEWALNDIKSREVNLDELEEAALWDGDDGKLVEALQRVGFLDENRLELWWEDGPGAVEEKRKADRERKDRERKKSRGKPAVSDGQPGKSNGQSRKLSDGKQPVSRGKPAVSDGQTRTSPHPSLEIRSHGKQPLSDGKQPLSDGKDTLSQQKPRTAGTEKRREEKRREELTHARDEHPESGGGDSGGGNISEGPSKAQADTQPEAPRSQDDAEQAEARQKRPTRSFEAIRDKFLEVYQGRCNAQPTAKGRYNKGLFGDGGHFDIRAYLDDLASDGYEKYLRVCLPLFWDLWDIKEYSSNKRTKRLYPPNLKDELESFLMSRGLPTPLQRQQAKG